MAPAAASTTTPASVTAGSVASIIQSAANGIARAAGGRIPQSLQAIFLASNRGNEVHQPPPTQCLRDFLGKKHSSKKKNLGSGAESNGNKEQQQKTTEAKIENPQEHLDNVMKLHGYSTKRYSTLKTAYHNKPTDLQKASYDLYLIGIVRKGEETDLQEILQSGISPNPCNNYGESLVHLVCRRGDNKLLQVMIQNGCDIQVADDYGRTPLHDACWAPEPAFETVEMLLNKDPTLLLMQDCRGFLPLAYVRKEHWAQWNVFIDLKKDVYWPRIVTTPVTVVSEFVEQDPNTRPLPDPENALPLDLANQVASGSLKPEEAIQLRNQRLNHHKRHRSPSVPVEEESRPDHVDDEEDSSESEYSDDDSDYDSDYDSDDDLLDEDVKEMIGIFQIQLGGAKMERNIRDMQNSISESGFNQ